MESKIRSTRAFIRAKYIKKDFMEKFVKTAKNISDNHKNKVYIFLAADYGNMGDIAITYAQKNFIKDHLKKNYEIEEIPLAKTYEYINKLNFSKNDIITIVGGGNMGERYEWIEEARRSVIKRFKDNKIISFPQTIEFSNTNLGKESLIRTQKIYNKNNNLYVFAREKNSYDMMKKYLKEDKVFLVPDIVFYLKDKIKKNVKNEEIGICFRNDSEKILNDEDEKEILNLFKNNKINKFDTHIGDEELIYEKRYDELRDFIQKVGKMKLVITDRLHGMIFSYITDTPCIVFDNANHKISATYNTWLKNCNLILLLDKLEKQTIVKFLEGINKNQIESDQIEFNYKELEEILNKQ